jgi:hypothetical protein
MRTKGLALLFLVAMACAGAAGCATAGKDRIIGTFEWSDGKGYVEQYAFWENYTFRAEALGAEFSGTWENAGQGRYVVRYTDVTGETARTEEMIFDGTTDAVYFPAHRRVA